MSDHLKLSHLAIYRMPGFLQKGFEITNNELSSGFNLIYGPNGSGKTTFLKALQVLIWPELGKGIVPLSLYGTFRYKDVEVTTLIEGNTMTRTGPSLQFPESELARCFAIGVDDLFAATDEELSLAIGREMAGGYDLGAIEKLPVLDLPKFAGRGEWKEFKQLFAEHKQLIAKREALSNHRLKIQALEAKIQEGRAAIREAERLKKTALRLSLSSRLQEIENQLSALPPGMCGIQGNEREVVRKLSTEKVSLQEELESLEQEMLKLPGMEMDAFLPLWKKNLDELGKIEESLARQNRERESLESELLRLKTFACGVSFDTGRSVQNLGSHLFDWKSLLFKREEIGARLSALTIDDREIDLKAVEKGIACLEKYLSSTWNSLERIGPWILAGLSLLPIYHGPFWALLSIPFFLFAIRIQRMTSPKKAWEEFVSIGLQFQQENPLAILEALRVFQAQAAMQSVQIGERDLLQRRYHDLSGQLEKLRERIQEQVGIDPYIGMEPLLGAIDKIHEIEQKLARLAGEISAWRGQKNQLLLQLEQLSPLKELQALLVAYERMKEALYHRNAKAALLDEKKRLKGRVERELSDLFTSLGCSSIEEIEERVTFLDLYRELQKEKIGLESQLGTPRNEEVIPENLEQEIRTLEEKGLDVERDIEEVASLKKELAMTFASDALDKSATKLSAAKKDLTAKYRDLYKAVIGRTLLKRLKENYIQNHAPKVFTEASAWFAKFTHGAYSLAPLEGTFKAIESATGLQKELSQLSRGTRMQLLLACRLSFAMREKLQLPLIFDEAFVHSDPERFNAMATAVIEIVKSGAQVFYLTCQSADLGAWQQLLKESSISSNFLNLETIKGKPPLEVIAQQRITFSMEEPGDLSLEDYLQKVGYIRATRESEVGSLDLAYFVENAIDYYKIRSLHIQLAGQLKNIYDQGIKVEGIPLALEREAFFEKWKLIQETLEKAKIGRGASLRREHFEEIGSKGAMLEKLLQLANEHKGHAKQIIDQLENKAIKGIRAATIEALREYTIENGLYDDRAPLTRNEIVAAVGLELPRLLHDLL